MSNYIRIMASMYYLIHSTHCTDATVNAPKLVHHYYIQYIALHGIYVTSVITYIVLRL